MWKQKPQFQGPPDEGQVVGVSVHRHYLPLHGGHHHGVHAEVGPDIWSNISGSSHHSGRPPRNVAFGNLCMALITLLTVCSSQAPSLLIDPETWTSEDTGFIQIFTDKSEREDNQDNYWRPTISTIHERSGLETFLWFDTLEFIQFSQLPQKTLLRPRNTKEDVNHTLIIPGSLQV